MKIKGYSSDYWAIPGCILFFTYSWGWSVQLMFLRWGLDVSYDYAAGKSCGGTENG